MIQAIIAMLSGRFGKAFICFVISMMPILELRGGLLAASPVFLDLPMQQAIPICILGNLLPIPFVLLFIERILVLMEKWSLTRGFAQFLRKKAEKRSHEIELYGFWSLVLFVGIPLPGTGAWTGSLVAALLHLPFKKAFGAIVLGVLLAALIMTLISYGLLGSLAL